MNLSVLPASCRQKKLGSADETSAARCRAARNLRRFMVPMRAQNEWRLSMNRRASDGFGLKNHIVFASQFLEEVLFGLRDFLFIFLESLFHVSAAVNHQSPEQFGQLAPAQGWQPGHRGAP